MPSHYLNPFLSDSSNEQSEFMVVDRPNDLAPFQKKQIRSDMSGEFLPNAIAFPVNTAETLLKSPEETKFNVYNFIMKSPDLLSKASPLAIGNASREFASRGRFIADLNAADYHPNIFKDSNKKSRAWKHLENDILRTRYYKDILMGESAYSQISNEENIDMGVWTDMELVSPIFYQPTLDSGVTFLDGIDLKAYNTKQKKDAFKNLLVERGVSSEVVDFLTPFLGLSGTKARNALKEYYKEFGLPAQIPMSEAAKVSVAFHTGTKIQETRNIFNNGLKANGSYVVSKPEEYDVKFDELRGYWKTAYYVMSAQFNRIPKFTNHLRTGNVQGALDELQNWVNKPESEMTADEKITRDRARKVREYVINQINAGL